MCIFTAHVRSMTGGYVFTDVCLSNFQGGVGTPSSWWGRGYPIPGPGGKRGCTPSQVQVGDTPSSWWEGYPLPGPCGGYPGVPPSPRTLWGIPPSRPRMGYPPIQDWMGYPPPCQETDQHSEHLLRGGQYASCVHAGGLSFRFKYFLIQKIIKFNNTNKKLL